MNTVEDIISEYQTETSNIFFRQITVPTNICKLQIHFVNDFR